MTRPSFFAMRWLALFVGVSGCTFLQAAELAEPTFRTILPDDGIESGAFNFRDARRDVLTSASDWESWWAEHSTSRRRDGSPEPAPVIDVDLASALLVAVTPGPQSSSCGKTIRVEGVTRSAEQLAVTVVTYLGGEERACRNAFMHPVHVVAVSPRGPVVFVEESRPGRPAGP